MLTRALKNSLRDGFKSIGRNFMLSLASIATITVSLIVLGVMYVLIRNINYMTTQMDDNISIVIFMQEGVSDDQINNLMTTLRARSEVRDLDYTSPEEALEDFRAQLAADGTMDPAILDYFDENPLADSANIEIFLTSSSAQSSLIEFLETQSDVVRKINYSADFAGVLSTASQMVTIIGMIIIAFLIVVTMVLITNTISASIVSRKEEIGIMKFLGASDVYVEGPFVVQGLVIGILGTVGPCLLIAFGYNYLLTLVTEMFSGVMTMFSFVPLGTIIAELFPMYAVLGIVLSILGTLFSMHKNLRV